MENAHQVSDQQRCVKNHKLITDRQSDRKRRKQKAAGRGSQAPGSVWRWCLHSSSGGADGSCSPSTPARTLRGELGSRVGTERWSKRPAGRRIGTSTSGTVCPSAEAGPTPSRPAPLFEGQTPTAPRPPAPGQVRGCARSSADKSPRRKAPGASPPARCEVNHSLIIPQIHTTGGDRL